MAKCFFAHCVIYTTFIKKCNIFVFLAEHAATCNGLEELTMDTCPICNQDYPPEQLPEHAQDCAQAWYD